MTVQLHSQRLTRLVAMGLAAGALAAPAASAMPAPLVPPESSGGGAQIAIEPDPAPVVQSVNDGFDWGSAAIGAGGAGGLLLLVSLSGFTYRARHHHIRLAQ